jgi:RNA polymerase sigma-70 factor, ECF subfamily
MPSVDRAEADSKLRDAGIAAAAGGDPAARWSALEACRDYLRLVVHRGRWSRHAGRSATSDLIQQTIVDGWRNFSRFRGRTPAQLHAWLGAILIHATLNARRRRRAAALDSGLQSCLIRGSTTPPDVAAQQSAVRVALDAALLRLTERHRAIIHLRIWDQLTFSEIGTRLCVSEDAARMLYGRALAKLRESMRPGHDPG